MGIIKSFMFSLFNEVLRRKRVGRQDLDVRPCFGAVDWPDRWDDSVDLVRAKLHVGRRVGVLSCYFHYCALVGFACRRDLGIVADF